jgi:hypothetical protein
MTSTSGDFTRKFFGPHRWGEAILCPNCGQNNLHHFRVTVFDRTEDSPRTVVTEVEKGRATTHLLPSGQTRNPSSRRDGVAIGFWCEQCPAKPELTIEQHKGETFIGWQATEPDGGAA